MFVLVLQICVVTLYTQTFIKNIVTDDEISQNVVDENTIMVSVPHSSDNGIVCQKVLQLHNEEYIDYWKNGQIETRALVG